MKYYQILKTKHLQLKTVALFLIFHFSFIVSKGQPTNRILFIFDDSYSMYAPWNSNIKIEVSKRIMGEFLDSLKSIPNLELALRCYGHQTFIKPVRDCKDSKLEIPFAPTAINALKIKQRIQKLEPLGTTPIAYSLGECASDFTPCSNCRNIIILITDGIEECGGDPCKARQKLMEKGIVFKPFIIGIGLSPEQIKTFECVGDYYDFDNASTLSNINSIISKQKLNKTSAQVNLLDSKSLPTETNVNTTFYNTKTGNYVYNYIHTLNKLNNPDTLYLDDFPTYKILVVHQWL